MMFKPLPPLGKFEFILVESEEPAVRLYGDGRWFLDGHETRLDRLLKLFGRGQTFCNGLAGTKIEKFAFSFSGFEFRRLSRDADCWWDLVATGETA